MCSSTSLQLTLSKVSSGKGSARAVAEESPKDLAGWSGSLKSENFSRVVRRSSSDRSTPTECTSASM